MYKKSVQGWLKHLDFMILDVVCLWISFTLAFGMRHGSLNVFANSLYRDMMWSLALMDIVVIFFFDSLKNVLKRGFYREFTMTVKQTCLITLCSVFYLFTFKEADNYSRLVLTYTAALYLLLSYITRNIWKYLLRKYLGENGRRSLLIVTVSEIVDTVIDNIKNKNYSDYIVTGVCILDDKAKGRTIDSVPVVADKEDLVEYVCREWVDEVFLNIPESESYPSDLLDKFIEMGVVVHMKLAKSQNLLGKKQFVERLGTYTVLTTSINSVSRRQIVLKRMLDILGGLAGCIITGILCIFVGPAIYIQSPGPIFFKQTRVGKNGKLFQMYKFRSMYMDAEERKAELMKENRVQDGMMFKLDFDPRIIGSKKLPDGTIKKGVGNFIRDWSLDEFPQFLNVLKGDMSLVGTRPPTVDEWDGIEVFSINLCQESGETEAWLKEIENGGDLSQTDEKNVLFSMHDFWKKAPVGGEFTSSLSMEEMLDTSLSQTVELIKKSHTTFLGPNIADKTYSEGYKAVLQNMGYRLWISKAALSPQLKGAKLELTWENAGSAPFYKEWPVWVYVTDEKGNLIEKKRIKISLPSVLPGNVKKTQTSMETINLSRDVGDKYHLSIGIEDPMTGKANLRMTMKCKYNDGMNFLW